jgi:hypothetical protein
MEEDVARVEVSRERDAQRVRTEKRERDMAQALQYDQERT